MATISENLRATLLSLKQISDRVKSLVTTSVTKSEATANKQAVLDALTAAKTALQGNDSTATLTAIESAISALNNPTVAQIQSGLAKETSVKDGNDTSVSVAKEVRSEVGTGSDTAAETGTLSAVLKWTKNKVKDIYTAVTGITGYALQGSDSTKSITTLDADLGDVAAALEYMEQGGMPQIAQIAKQGTNANANISEIQALIGYTISEIDNV